MSDNFVWKEAILDVSVVIYGMTSFLLWHFLIPYLFCWKVQYDGKLMALLSLLMDVQSCNSHAFIQYACRGIHCKELKDCVTDPGYLMWQILVNLATLLWTSLI